MANSAQAKKRARQAEATRQRNASQKSELLAFYERFLFGRDVATGVLRTAGNGSYDASWAPWKMPVLVAGVTFRNASEGGR